MPQKKPEISGVSAQQDASFDKALRVRKRFEYRLVQNQGRRASTRHFVVLIRDHAESDRGPARLGITVSKKVGNAVERNRVKRVIRDVFRRNKTLFRPNRDYVFIAKVGAATLSAADFFVELQGIARALGGEAAKTPPKAPRSHP